MAFESAPPVLGIRDRPPHDNAVGSPLFNVHNEHRPILPSPLRAGLESGWLKVRIARTQWATDVRG
jgi:hypothetical protein